MTKDNIVWLVYDRSVGTTTDFGYFPKGEARPVPADKAEAILQNRGFGKAMPAQIEKGKRFVDAERKAKQVDNKNVTNLIAERRKEKLNAAGGG